MKWRRVEKSRTPRPVSGVYHEWKSILARESDHQCVYCCIHESKFGGTRNFHVEHWKPQSKFELLTNAFENLFYACGICNIFKSNDWPGEPTEGLDAPFYPDPSSVDYASFLQADSHTGMVSSETVTGKYIITRLHLNRPQLIIARRTHEIIAELKQIKDELRKLAGVAGGDTDRLIIVIDEIGNFFHDVLHARPYTKDDEKVTAAV
jgi:hypothetical protein